jgi:hypothetical protein
MGTPARLGGVRVGTWNVFGEGSMLEKGTDALLEALHHAWGQSALSVPSLCCARTVDGARLRRFIRSQRAFSGVDVPARSEPDQVDVDLNWRR